MDKRIIQERILGKCGLAGYLLGHIKQIKPADYSMRDFDQQKIGELDRTIAEIGELTKDLLKS